MFVEVNLSEFEFETLDIRGKQKNLVGRKWVSDWDYAAGEKNISCVGFR